MLCLAGCLLWLAAQWSERSALAQLRTAGQHRLDVYTGSLRNAVDRYTWLPFVLSSQRDLADLLRAPQDAVQLERVNRYLKAVNDAAQASAIYVLNAEGLALASSNWDTPQSYIGNNYAFRPYYQQARLGYAGRFYGVGFTTQQPGYFLSYPIRDGERVLGVVVAKVSLDALESNWRVTGERMLVSDKDGIAFLATDPAWKWHTLAPLPSYTLRYIKESRQYGRNIFPALGLLKQQRLDNNTQLARFKTGSDQADLLVQTAKVPDLGWQIVLFTDLTPIRQGVSRVLLGTSLGLLALLAWYLFWRQRRRRIRDNLRASQALKQAHDQLEQKVAARTDDLLGANTQLQREIAERIRTELDLRAAQNELVQAGKMAVLGQMAAGVTHELNQPLTAMRALADNAKLLLERGNIAAVASNLLHISQLTERMGKITGQLRSFARKSDNRAEAVLLTQSISNALLLLEQRLRQQRVALNIEQPEQVWVRCNAVRLEQVLINLLRNALDAVKNQPAACITLAVQQAQDKVKISVLDNGPGIAAEQLASVFDPFFTTKGDAEGLGLGLAISLSIVRDFGGNLQASNRPEGGACFELELLAAKV
ncbi:ATP-binding protein [Iodobacter fluviatilis]|uniref:C4-dicarboxylate transport sensor protein DctB n=1 Tax=Iodobacter fluviatilis TaxID=537 RepID=A0A377Q9V1_9NEIS|nr:ATP-binding protein [Iodobacter fluviatilis]TCU82382.1 two-component system C4-dicarboxylate transport sensor histidine kinase DctB [Iodobacter fluviatilis]STQ91607.1 C4-dicarboxylate transport sensor protein dctB [Iodobacter fluviatilis]